MGLVKLSGMVGGGRMLLVSEVILTVALVLIGRGTGAALVLWQEGKAVRSRLMVGWRGLSV
jgi:hypothetical protein